MKQDTNNKTVKYPASIYQAVDSLFEGLDLRPMQHRLADASREVGFNHNKADLKPTDQIDKRT